MLEAISNISIVEWMYYFFSVIIIIGALGTILSKNPMYSILYLVATFFALSGIYTLLNAQFLAVVNIIVYAGAIMVLFLFVVMFLNFKREANILNSKSMVLASIVSGGVLFLMLAGVLRKAEFAAVNPETFRNDTGMIETLGDLLYNHYMLPFELVSVLFLTAISGAILLGKREKGENHF